MNLVVTVACVLGLICCAAETPMEECRYIEAKNFDEKEITHFWRATHTAVTPKAEFTTEQLHNCTSMTIQHIPSGIQIRHIAGPEDKIAYNSTSEHYRTEIPGFYKGSPRRADMQFYVHRGYLLTQICYRKDLHNSYNIIFSRRSTTPKSVVRYFVQYLNEYGFHVDRIHKLPSTYCD